MRISEIYLKEAFMNPFPGKFLDRKLTDREIVRSIRQSIAAEQEAIHLYESIADATDNEEVKHVFQDVANEEKVHVGEFMKLLEILDIDEKKSIEDGKEEVEDIIQGDVND